MSIAIGFKGFIHQLQRPLLPEKPERSVMRVKYVGSDKQTCQPRQRFSQRMMPVGSRVIERMACNEWRKVTKDDVCWGESNIFNVHTNPTTNSMIVLALHNF